MDLNNFVLYITYRVEYFGIIFAGNFIAIGSPLHGKAYLGGKIVKNCSDSHYSIFYIAEGGSRGAQALFIL